MPRQVQQLLKIAKKLQQPEETAVVAQEKAQEAVADAKQAQVSAKIAQQATEALVDIMEVPVQDKALGGK